MRRPRPSKAFGPVVRVALPICFEVKPMSTSFFHDMLGSIADRGRALIERSAIRSTTDGSDHPGQSSEDLEALCRDLLSGRGEASGVALARRILDLYASLPVEQRLDFFRLLA